MAHDVQQWIKDHRAGLSTHKIAVKYGTHQVTVWTALRAAGVKTRRPRQREQIEERIDEVIACFHKTGTYLATGKALGFDPSLISEILRARGIERPGPKRMRALQDRGVRMGCLGPTLARLPKTDREAIVSEAAAREKTVAEVLVEDWEPLT